MKHIVIGTAGHVDHGKTALVKTLTGVDPDRLKEEQERGITIDLGFAPLALADGQKVGIVDVPGHERFIKNMVAGAAGIDLVILVIAADEGIMPQTREHLEICDLLGIKRGLVALTKIDLVDQEWLELMMEDIREFLAGTFLAEAPIIPLSVMKGIGIDDFLAALNEAVAATEERRDTGFFRLPIDRVFTIKGFGTVLTGTLLSGTVNVGETIEIMPRQMKVKIRGIQVHNETNTTAGAGQRTALNLQGIDREEITRGDVLAQPDVFKPSTRFDVFLHYLPTSGKKLKNRSLVRFHIGTVEIPARLILLDREELEPGTQAYAQFILKSPTIATSGDHFVIRSYSPLTTVGGGAILDPHGRKHKKNREELLNDLKHIRTGTNRQKTLILLARSELGGTTIPELSARTGIPLNEQNKILEDLLSKREALLVDKDERLVIAYPAYQELIRKMVETIRSYHERYPLKEGISKEELRMTLGKYINPKLFARILRDLEKEGTLFSEKDLVRITAHKVNLKGELEELSKKISKIYLQAHLTPPTKKELLEQFAEKQTEVLSILAVMIKEGTLVKINEDLFFNHNILEKLKDDYRLMLIRDGQASPATFRDMSGLTRKFIIPLMEYFDKTKFTIRVGDHRILREGGRK